MTPRSSGASPLASSMRRIKALMQRDLAIFFTPPGVGVIVLGVSYGVIEGVIFRITEETSVIASFLNLHIPLISLIIGTVCSGLIVEERAKRTGELLFATPVTPLEYLVSKWVVGVIVAILGSYLGMVLFIMIAGLEHLELLPKFIWLHPPLMAMTWVSAGVLVGVIWVTSSWAKKILYTFAVFAPPTAIFLLEYVLGLHGRHLSSLPSWAPWLMTALYSLVCLLLLGRKFEVRSFVR